MYDAVIVGGGPAGLTAALYMLRAGKSAVVIEKDAFGGQITWSPRVENYPALEAVSGAQFGEMLVSQVLAQGGELMPDTVTGIDLHDSVAMVQTVSGALFEGRTLIDASGAKPRRLGLAREDELTGAGVSFCALCDGAFYNGQPVAVVGGGSAAIQDALYLADICSRVYLIHRGGSFRAEAAIVQALKARKNVELLMDSRVTALQGDTELTGVIVTDKNAGERELSVNGVFAAVGREPDNDLFAAFMTLDSNGYADSGEDCTTKTPLLFAAGDCRRKAVRQLTTAVSDGTCAAMAACRYLDAL